MNRFRILLLAAVLILPGVAWAVTMGIPHISTWTSTYSPFTSSAVVVADTQVSAVPAFLQCIIISQNDAAPTAGSLIVYDNTAESGTIVFSHTFTTAVFMPIQVCPQRIMTVGIYLGFTTTGDVNVSVSYRPL